MAVSLLEQAFHEVFPKDWCQDTLRAVAKAYEKTMEHCVPPLFGQDEAHDVRSHYCRGIFEAEWRRLSNKYPKIKAESRRNKAGNYSHTYVKSGNIILTASAVPSPAYKPRRADFRDTYNGNGQLGLFEQDSIADAEDIYAILLYGPPQSVSPGFVTIAFPSNHWHSYVERINLLALHPNIISTIIPEADPIEVKEPIIQPIRVSPEEKIEEPLQPQIRRFNKQVGEKRQ
ncbi:hypothetical protein [Anabaena lutea]|uniref:Transposase n=1 Tax=Anabaena lutea FACHB-196 TaxID=2692881 RepID=A0ABR8FI92_9NOST|nr:hypothetical protein [Anabaena lutea]MBD2569881.1 hypothetical protein [Anabaena lutea FACHB-196]